MFPRPTSASSVLSTSSTKDKPRLYIALSPRCSSFSHTDANCDSYHWILLVGPKSPIRDSAGTRHHVEHLSGPSQRYLYVADDAEHIPSPQSIIVRVAVAKIVDPERLAAILREIPVQQDDTSWNCLSWVKDAFLRFVEDDKRCVKGYVVAKDWKDIERRTREYAKKKRDSRRPSGDSIPTWNLWENRETTF
jgi:hypothetical protein